MGLVVLELPLVTIARAVVVAVCDDVALQEACYLLFNLVEYRIEVRKRLELVSK